MKNAENTNNALGKSSRRARGNKAVDSVPAEPVQSVETVSETETSNTISDAPVAVSQETRKMITFKLQRNEQGEVELNNFGAAAYKVEGRSGILRVGPQLFDDVNALPDTIELPLPVPDAKAREAKPKMTKEERKARRDAMTPEEKLAEQEARLEKQKANLLARKAKLGLLEQPELTDQTEVATA